MVLTSSTSSQAKSSSSLARKIKIRQIADSARGSGGAEGRSSSTSSSRLTAMQQQQQQQLHSKVRKIATETSSGSGSSGGGAGASKLHRPRNSSGGCVLHQSSSSASAAGRSVTSRRAASPVLSQSGRRQLLVGSCRRASQSPEPELLKLRPISKSASLPANLQPQPEDDDDDDDDDGGDDETSSGSKRISALKAATGHSILKRSSSSSSLLASLLQLRRQRRKTERKAEPESAPQQRKCVSFSADTIERQVGEERERPLRKQPLHEAKLYRKGVLQDQRCGNNAGRGAAGNLPLSWEESLGGPRALLGAAHDADDELVQRIVNLANKVGLGNIQLNAQDNSGRTAISYLAGNGSALVLEACLALAGADANLPDNEGNTPLHFAAQAGQTECLNILLQRCPNIEVDARNHLGFTPLMKAGVQGRTKCAKILLFAGANPTLRDHGRGLRAEQWARFCGRYVCAEVIERFARHRLLEKTTSCRWGSEPELAAQVLQGKLMPVAAIPVPPPPASGLKSKIRRVFRTTSNSDKTSFSLVSQLTSAALCASSPVLPKPGDVSPAVKSLFRPLSVPQLRITLVTPHQEVVEKTSEKCSHSTTFTEKIESTMVKPPRTKKKSK